MATSQQPMGMGALGGTGVIFKRKFRWTFALNNICVGGANTGSLPPSFVKLAARPNLSIEETEINFLNAKTWIPGKATWETITVTYYDVGGDTGADMSVLFSWLASVYDITDPVNLRMSSKRGGTGTPGYAASAVLNLYDGCGTVMENWQLENVWPQAINFGELDYSSSEEVTIELTLRYSQVKYTPLCPKGTVQPCCTGC